MKHRIAWQTAYPLWRDTLGGAETTVFKTPAILRFESDDFMEELAATLADDASALSDFVVGRENSSGADEPYRLYLPAHERYYLAAASLVCRIPGLPDRGIRSAAGEMVSFVIRRVVHRAEGGRTSTDEYGWFGNDVGWKLLDNPQGIDQLPPNGSGNGAISGNGTGSSNGTSSTTTGEERLPMFPVPIADRNVNSRRLLVGFIPVGRREQYEAAPRDDANAELPADYDDDPLGDMRQQVYEQQVANTLTTLDLAIRASSTAPNDAEAVEGYNFALLDLAQLLSKYIPDVLSKLEGGTPTLSSLEQAVYYAIYPLREHIVAIWENREALLGLTNGEVPSLPTDDLTRDEVAAFIVTNLRTITSAVGAYIAGTDAPAPTDDAVLAATRPASDAGSTYLLRCVYERPRCLPYEQPVVSEPSVEFNFASFFDPGMPMRPARITLPPDTSIAGLRKYGRSVQVQISDSLRQQISRMSGAKLSDLEDNKVPDQVDLPNLGMICSFSIPIITICALILLLIIVSLLNLAFWWLPFFKICLPLNLKAK